MIPSMDNIFCWVSVGGAILTIEPSAKISIPPEGKVLLIELKCYNKVVTEVANKI